MHTAICAFDTEDAARNAVDRLVELGFARRDIHVEHRTTMERAPRSPVGTEGQLPEAPGERGPLEAFGHFVVSLFGRDHPTGEPRGYQELVERGHAVVVVDVADPAEAKRAQDLLEEMEARQFQLLERRGQRPLHELVGMRRASDKRSVLGQSYGPSLADTAAAQVPARESTYDTERATASNASVDDVRRVNAPAGDLERTGWMRESEEKKTGR